MVSSRRKEIVKTTKVSVPSVKGVTVPFSNAVKAGGFVFVAGQTAFPEGVEKDLKTQAKKTLEKIKLILEESGTGLDNVVQTRVFLCNIEDYDAMNEVYKEYFPQDQPARTTIQAGKLYPGCLVEIDAIAILPKGS